MHGCKQTRAISYLSCHSRFRVCIRPNASTAPARVEQMKCILCRIPQACRPRNKPAFTTTYALFVFSQTAHLQRRPERGVRTRGATLGEKWSMSSAIAAQSASERISRNRCIAIRSDVCFACRNSSCCLQKRRVSICWPLFCLRAYIMKMASAAFAGAFCELLPRVCNQALRCLVHMLTRLE